MTLAKRIPIGSSDRRTLDLRVEAYNIWNHTQFSAIDSGARFDATGKQTNANFGAYSAARAPRILAFNLRFAF